MKNLIPAVICLFLAISCQAGIIYVDANAPLGGDGSTWGTAYKYLQDALYKPPISGDEIWVATGIYKPDQDEGGNATLNDRTATFQLINGVAIYGGYAGFGEPEPNDRNIELYEAILSGDLSGNDRHVSNPRDLSNDPCRAENSYNVVTGSGTDANAILDGFTITAGYNNFEAPVPPSGGGMLNREGNPTVRNCTFSRNMALVWGHGMGGGMHNYNSSATIINCTFTGNSAGAGGGMHNRTWRSNNKTVVVNCTFIGNYAKGKGGGVRNYNSSPIITNCIFSGNWSDENGGGMFNNFDCTPMVSNCTFSGNIAVKGGGGICNENNPYYGDSTPIVTDCILWNNSDGGGTDESAQIYGGIPIINYNCIQGWTGAIGGIGNIDADPCFVEPGYWDVSGVWVEGDYHLLPGSLCIDAGDNNSVPADIHDLDGDGNTTEPIPFDLDGNPRIFDGNDDGNSVVDMGAYEFFVPAIEADIDIDPDTLNLKGKGKWITCYIWPPEGYDVADIDPNSVWLEEVIAADWMWLDEEEQIAIAKFSRCEVQDILYTGQVELTISGELTDGTRFQGTDTIKVIDKGNKK